VKYGLKINYNIIVYSAVICLSLYFVSIISGINLIPIATTDRYIDSGIIRVTLWNYGLFDWVLNLAFIVLLLKIKIENKRLLYYSGILMAFAIVLTLTRRELVGRIINFLIIIIMVNYIFKSLRNFQIVKLIIPAAFLFGLLYLTFPQYLVYATDEYKNLSKLIITGVDKEGNIDYRLAGTGDVVAMKQLIKENLFFGVGFTRYSYEDLSTLRNLNNTLAGLYAGGELPFLGSIGKVGLVGLILFLPLYFSLFVMSYKVIKIIRKNTLTVLINQNRYEIVFIVFVLTFAVNKFTFNLYNIFVETYNARAFLIFVIILCILIVCYNNLSRTLKEQKAILQNSLIA
jgi:hypothetical protein